MKWRTTEGRVAATISEGGKRFPLILLPAKKRQVTHGKNVLLYACCFHLRRIKKIHIPFYSLIYHILTKQIGRSNKEKVDAHFAKRKRAESAIKSKIHFLKTRIVLFFYVAYAS